MWNIIIPILLGLLGEFLVALAKNMRRNRLSNLPEVAYSIVEGVDKQHPDWSGKEKRAFAYSAIEHHIRRNNGVAKESVINCLIELAVQKIKDR